MTSLSEDFDHHKKLSGKLFEAAEKQELVIFLGAGFSRG